MIKSEVYNLLYVEKDYSKIKELLQNSKESWSFNVLAKIHLNEGNIEKAIELYEIANNNQCLGYCHFLIGNEEKSKKILSQIRNYSSFTHWILFLIDLINRERKLTPTYMQIRNFYEQDIEMLYMQKQYNRIQKIINQNVYLEQFNREVYKFSARVLFNNNFKDEAIKFLKKSLDICYKDPETHYLLGEIYQQKNEKYLAIDEYKKAIAVIGGYLPAEKRLKDLLY
ncbi:tetratricopeptide repeat protein [bacterium]|nr:tetratricopeptide repeat protein [bacterium]